MTDFDLMQDAATEEYLRECRKDAEAFEKAFDMYFRDLEDVVYLFCRKDGPQYVQREKFNSVLNDIEQMYNTIKEGDC